MTQLIIQKATTLKSLPTKKQFQGWINATLPKSKQNSEITIRIVDNKEITTLNRKYRKKNKVTNIISFPFEAPKGIKADILGDLVICATQLRKEAIENKKTFISHWAHLAIHGTLHLLGHDHQNDKDAIKMEKLETKILKKLGFDDPYKYC